MCTPSASRPWIRLRWRLPCAGLRGYIVEGHWRWEPDTPAVRAAFQAAVDAGNRAYGAGTHWVEQEEAEAPAGSQISDGHRRTIAKTCH
ncbi:hypothetical protein EJP67_27880 [Variovorax guangxiensis]|uniref:Uncharacterized protein n=1 Tax=Variovorax guangxiensis TaxID=1775474 RepID=A0A433MSP3_9BURK|nr:hypothetical protein [Variovorax guangxiensis]RUR70883.1 hypothetical protein EJP67_27880 [Variovorax guangxiensis]